MNIFLLFLVYLLFIKTKSISCEDIVKKSTRLKGRVGDKGGEE